MIPVKVAALFTMLTLLSAPVTLAAVVGATMKDFKAACGKHIYDECSNSSSCRYCLSDITNLINGYTTDSSSEPYVLPPSEDVCLFGRTGVVSWITENSLLSSCWSVSTLEKCAIDYIHGLCGDTEGTVPPSTPTTRNPPSLPAAITCACECEVTAPLEKGTDTHCIQPNHYWVARTKHLLDHTKERARRL
jgi:hypothetical protein